ncbi:MAG: diguanylate cyclase [Symploca sp. SIO2B6]|nr:diguanylate cyclase [Symploca sp. SIO2B6]
MLQFPDGPVPLESKFYIERPPIEALTCQELCKPGSVIRIQAPRKMGKSSLLIRILAFARSKEFHTVHIDLQRADEEIFTTLERFLRWFCYTISRQLDLVPLLDQYWDDEIGSKISCTFYLQERILANLTEPVVIALNEVNRLFEYPTIAKEFLPLLRSWYEEAKQVDILKLMRLVVVHSTEIYVPLNINQSPFNVGLPIKLPEFTLNQVKDLALRHELDSEWCESSDLADLVTLVGGHPYRIRMALMYLQQGGMTIQHLLDEAATLSGIYQYHLRELLDILQAHPKLLTAFTQLVHTEGSIALDPILTYKLESMGLAKLDGNRARLSCQLYERFFKTQLFPTASQETQVISLTNHHRVQQLERENLELQQLVNVDSLTQVANRRYFDHSLTRAWQQLSQQQEPLSLILCDIDFFKTYNDTYGHQAGDTCLQKVARIISQCAQRPTDLVARYGGEEFTILLPNTGATGASQVAQVIQKEMQMLSLPSAPAQTRQFSSVYGDKSSSLLDGERFIVAPEEIPPSQHPSSGVSSPSVTLSFGVASVVPSSIDCPEALVMAADRALYESKARGRNRITLSSEFHFGI